MRSSGSSHVGTGVGGLVGGNVVGGLVGGNVVGGNVVGGNVVGPGVGAGVGIDELRLGGVASQRPQPQPSFP